MRKLSASYGLKNREASAPGTTSTPGTRLAELSAAFDRRNGRTVLADAYFTAPLKLAKTLPVEGASGGVFVTVMDASPGMMDGDRYRLQWTLGAGASVAATTQSYAKVHPCPRLGAAQTTEIIVGEGASLVYAPQPTMLYTEARFRGGMKVALAANASLILLDTLCMGRVHYGAGEVNQYRLYENELLVIVEGKPAAVNRVRFAPGEQLLHAPGVFENYTHIGALYGFGPFVNRAAVEALLPEARRNPEVRCGVSLLARGGLAAMALGRSAWEVQEVLLALGRALAAFASDHAPPECTPFVWPSW